MEELDGMLTPLLEIQPPSQDTPLRSSSKWLGLVFLGVGLEVCAAAIGTLSKQLIATSTRDGDRKWMFHLGAFLNIAVGPLVDASAYAFAPAVIVAPFSCLDVIFNALSAPYTLSWQEERLSCAHWMGTAFVAAGAGLTAVFAIQKEAVLDVYRLEDLLERPIAIIYVAAELAAVIIMALLLQTGRLRASIRGPALGVLAGVLVGNVFLIKGFTGLVRYSLNNANWDAWVRPTPYVMVLVAVVAALGGHVFLKRGLAEYKGVFMVTIFEGAHVVAACLSGSVVMSEMEGLGWMNFLFYWLSVGLIVLGIAIINRNATEARLGRQTMSFIASFSAPDMDDGDRRRTVSLPIVDDRRSSLVSTGTHISGTSVAVSEEAADVNHRMSGVEAGSTK